jgi:transposase
MRVADKIELDAQVERELRILSKRRRVEARVQQRASIVLLAAKGWQNKEIAVEVKLDRRQVALWRRRFSEGGIEALLQDAPRSGRTPSVTPEVESRILKTTLNDRPPAATHWSTRTLGEHLGLSATTIRRVWARNGLKPHLQRTFKLSRDPRFVDKLFDVVGLYLEPPDKAIVLSCDEKSQIQALNRTQPGLPMKRGRAGTMTHDYKRNGTTTLFAALNTLDGTVISMCQERHRHDEWLKFLRLIDRKTAKQLTLHLIVDNYATHKHPEVQAWLTKHPRFVMHFTPTSASWLNMVERFFRDISENRIRRDSFTSVNELEQAIAQYIEHHIHNPKPFTRRHETMGRTWRYRRQLDQHRPRSGGLSQALKRLSIPHTIPVPGRSSTSGPYPIPCLAAPILKTAFLRRKVAKLARMSLLGRPSAPSGRRVSRRGGPGTSPVCASHARQGLGGVRRSHALDRRITPRRYPLVAGPGVRDRQLRGELVAMPAHSASAPSHTGRPVDALIELL